MQNIGGGEEEMRQTYLRLDDELHRQLRYEAAERDLSMNSCIIALLKEALEVRRASFPIEERNLQRRQS